MISTLCTANPNIACLKIRAHAGSADELLQIIADCCPNLNELEFHCFESVEVENVVKIINYKQKHLESLRITSARGFMYYCRFPDDQWISFYSFRFSGGLNEMNLFFEKVHDFDMINFSNWMFLGAGDTMLNTATFRNIRKYNSNLRSLCVDGHESAVQCTAQDIRNIVVEGSCVSRVEFYRFNSLTNKDLVDIFSVQHGIKILSLDGHETVTTVTVLAILSKNLQFKEMSLIRCPLIDEQEIRQFLNQTRSSTVVTFKYRDLCDDDMVRRHHFHCCSCGCY